MRQSPRNNRLGKRLCAACLSAALFVTGLPAFPPGVAAAEANNPFVVEYTFDRATGTSCPDSSGNRRNGTPSGDVLIGEGQWGSAAVLGGTDGYIDMPSDIWKDVTAFTISTWVYVEEGRNFARLCDFGSGLDKYMYIVPDTLGSCAFVITTNGAEGEQKFWSTKRIPIGEWVHVTVTLDGTAGRMYFGEELVGWLDTMSLSPADLGTTTQNYLGRSIYHDVTGDPYFKGKIDQFTILNYAVAQEDIGTLMADTDQDIVDRENRCLDIGVSDGQYVVSNLTLPDVGQYGSSIVWSSNAPDVLSNAGTVTRPSGGEGNAVVQLTATITKNSASATRIYHLIVPMEREDQAAYPLLDLDAVKLDDGIFKTARDLNVEYLLSNDFDPDRQLHNFRVNAGLPSSATPLSSAGWDAENHELRGHTLGHWLSASAMVIQETGNETLKTRADYVVAELAKCQKALGGKYLSAFPTEFFDRLENGIYVWAPYYVIHKIMAGLMDMYVRTGNTQALEVARGMGDWIYERNKDLSAEAHQHVLDMEYGGIGEGLYNLYALTGDQKHYLAGQVFEETDRLLTPLKEGRDILNGLHVNTLIPKIIAAARRYELDGNEDYRKIVENFWTMIEKRDFPTGGVGNYESFGPANELEKTLSESNCETCNVYNLMKLARMLYSWTGEAKYMEYYEKAMFNQILASQHPETGMNTYYQGLTNGSKRVFNEHEAFPCCNGTGIENFSKLADSIYAQKDGTLYVNQWISSTLDWTDKKLFVTQKTDFPQGDTVTLIFHTDEAGGVEAGLGIRLPSWLAGDAVVSVNESAASGRIEGGYLYLDRTFSDGDTVTIKLPMALHTESMPDNNAKQAVLYGPILLVGDCRESDNGTNPILAQFGVKAADLERFSDVVADYVQAQAGMPLTYTMADQARTIELIPYYKAYQNRYIVYWHLLDEDSVAYQAYQRIRQTKLSTSYCTSWETVYGLNDGKEPFSSSYKNGLMYGNYDTSNTTQWVQYDFDKAYIVSDASVYWYQDTLGIRMPKAWRIQYWGDEGWKDVESRSAAQPLTYDTKADRYNTCTFSPVTTQKVRMEIDNQSAYSSGILQWKVSAYEPTGESPQLVVLRELIENCKAIDLSGYTEASGSALKRQMDRAEVLLRAENPTEDTLKQMISSLTEAKVQLHPIWQAAVWEAETLSGAISAGIQNLVSAGEDDGVGYLEYRIGTPQNPADSQYAPYGLVARNMPAGNYTMTLRVKVLEHTAPDAARVFNIDGFDQTLNIVDQVGEVKASMLPVGDWRDVTLSFKATQDHPAIEFRVWFDANVHLLLDRVTIVPQAEVAPDWTALDDLLAQYETEALDAVIYTEESWAAYAGQLEKAKALANSITAEQSVIDSMVTVLRTAHDALARRSVDKTVLTSLIKQMDAKKLQSGAFTAQSWKAYSDTYSTANKLLSDELTTQKQIDDALNALLHAYAALEPIPAVVDKTKLLEILKTVKDLKAGDYTVDSWQAFDAVRKLAETVAEDLNVSQGMIDRMTEALDKAKGALLKKSGNPAPPPAEKTGWHQVNGKWYFSESSGAMVTGWKKLGKWYYFGTDGAMKTGWYQVNGKWYFSESSGAMVTGWKKLGKWYYFGTDGAMKTGWQRVGGKWYYLESSGKMVYSTARIIQHKEYIFNSNGQCMNP